MDIEIYALRIFCQVITDKTFSRAARSLGLTQPTVSQQIARLESTLNEKLFERVGHDVIPTQAAKDLYSFGLKLIEQVDEFSDGVQRKRSLPQGKVRYAMPESCQWTPHFRKIMNRTSAFPDIHFEIEILPNSDVVKGLLDSTLDFGFVVGERPATELRFEKFSDERYSAVASTKELLRSLSSNDLGALRLISYPGWAHYLEVWAKAHGLWKIAKVAMKSPIIKVGTLAGAIHAVKEGAGIAVIPTHCVATELSSGNLIAWNEKRGNDAFSPIYLARRAGEKLPRRVEVVIDLLPSALI